MVVDAYTALLQELGKSLGITLTPDKANCCVIQYKDGVKVDVELEGEMIVLAADLGEVPVGSYREKLFQEALKANGQPSPLNGVLGFSMKLNHLILFTQLSLKDLNGERIAAALLPFENKAKVWKDALQRGEVPVVQAAQEKVPSGMFGLMR